MTSWRLSQRIFNMNNIANNINSLSSPGPISGTYILQEWNRYWATIYVNYVHRLHDSPLFSAALCNIHFTCCSTISNIKYYPTVYIYKEWQDRWYLSGAGSECGNKIGDAKCSLVTIGQSCLVSEIWPWTMDGETTDRHWQHHISGS